MLKAALPAIPVVNRVPGLRRSGSTLPPLTLTRDDVAVDRAHVAAYAEVCGFAVKDTLPLTYPHLLAFGLHLAIMTDASFPFPAMGTVHLENSLTQHRPIGASERLEVTARPAHLRPHPKGRVFDLVTEVALGRRAGLGGDQHVPADRRRRPRPRRPAASRSRSCRRAASSGGCPATSAGGTPRCQATTTRSTSTP